MGHNLFSASSIAMHQVSVEGLSLQDFLIRIFLLLMIIYLYNYFNVILK